MSALIIAVGHGTYSDPFTCSTQSTDTDNLADVEDCLQRLQQDQFPDDDLDTLRCWIDEILVVGLVNESMVFQAKVIHHYGADDGLGDFLEEDEEG